MTDPRRRWLAAMGIQVWEQRRPILNPAAEPVSSPALSLSPTGSEPIPPSAPEFSTEIAAAPDDGRELFSGDPRSVRISAMTWDELAAAVRDCTACGLQATRTQTVFGVGDRQAEWLVIGEAPGADEDRQGEPFVGRAGKLLDAMLLAIGLPRQQVYIANILKCRPPNNRDPAPEEARCCRPFLDRQIVLIRPKIILAAGRIAAQNLLGTDTPIGRLRGKVHRLPGAAIPVVVTYHPAYLLRSPREKRRAWDDLRLARRTLAAES